MPPSPSKNLSPALPPPLTQSSLLPSISTPEPPPNGGLQAWTQVLSSHLCVFNSFGYINSFGIFQQYYSTTLALPPSTISWIGSLQILLVYFIGTFSGRALDAGYYRLVLFCGLVLQLVGVFMTSLSSEYWHLLLTQGLCQGLGDGLIFCPAVANTATYFSSRRTMAISCVACGGATGGMVFPAIAGTLLGKLGFPWTVRVMGFVMLFNAVCILSLARPRLGKKSLGPAPLVEWRAFGELTYLLYVVSMFFAFVGVWVAYFYVRPFSRTILHVSDSTSFNLILLINGVGIPGRLVPALIADKYVGPINVFIPTLFLAGVLLFSWAAVNSASGIMIFTIFYGFFGAGVQSLLQAGLASLNTDPKKAGVRIGMGFSVVGIASLLGGPIGGALVQKADGRYLGTQMFAGACLVVGSVVLVGARVVGTGGMWGVKM
ncbi:MFS general substrate transporter [Lepidopterella palustris CBS 459.81]|uniref:MFS general substrate transporter n=1 Tax=Lepidopterella palustris CBS 459.81 TaxID=1314670 RepID=A0A8E2JH14_9PEZI|nr:MFS general substrate transporter [Lepidopterella palustris CBS 459.81]